MPADSVTIVGDPLLARLAPADMPPAAAGAHPLAQVRQAAVEQRARSGIGACAD